MRISDWSSDVCSSDLMDNAANLKLRLVARFSLLLHEQALKFACARFDSISQLLDQNAAFRVALGCPSGKGALRCSYSLIELLPVSTRRNGKCAARRGIDDIHRGGPTAKFAINQQAIRNMISLRPTA